MQLMPLLHKLLKKELSFVHKTRLETVMDVCSTAVRSHKLYLTGLGREMNNQNKTSSNIQKVDRLLGNTHLHAQHGDFYKAMMHYVVQKEMTQWIHVDWLCINAVTELYALRASLSMSGRSIVLYEECHPRKKVNNHVVHKAFLNRLKEMLPVNTQAVIVTDAGFRAPWFTHVRSLGWDFVGRLRNKNLVRLERKEEWQLSSTFFEQATGKPTYIGSALLTVEQQVCVHVVLYKEKNKNRHQVNKNKKVSSSGKSKRYSKANKEPWVLVTSLPASSDLARQTVNIYRQRMRIEENIRDTKCSHYGLGLKKSLSRCPKRMDTLLLIGAIATFAAWLAGLWITHQGKAADFQAHSAKFKSALSKVFLGREVLKRGLSMTTRELSLALTLLHQTALAVQLEGSA